MIFHYARNASLDKKKDEKVITRIKCKQEFSFEHVLINGLLLYEGAFPLLFVQIQ